jgi:integrase
VSRLLKKRNIPATTRRRSSPTPKTNCPCLYGHADADERFLLDFFIGSMARDHEAYGCCYSDLTGVTLTIRGKQHKTRTVEISPRLGEEINQRRKRSDSEYLFPTATENRISICFGTCRASPKPRDYSRAHSIC